jgi:hypothetical protein
MNVNLKLCIDKRILNPNNKNHLLADWYLIFILLPVARWQNNRNMHPITTTINSGRGSGISPDSRIEGKIIATTKSGSIIRLIENAPSLPNKSKIPINMTNIGTMSITPVIECWARKKIINNPTIPVPNHTIKDNSCFVIGAISFLLKVYSSFQILKEMVMLKPTREF